MGIRQQHQNDLKHANKFVNFPGPISLPSWSVFDQAKALSFLLSSF
jgi:hypothetical protein